MIILTTSIVWSIRGKFLRHEIKLVWDTVGQREGEKMDSRRPGILGLGTPSSRRRIHGERRMLRPGSLSAGGPLLGAGVLD